MLIWGRRCSTPLSGNVYYQNNGFCMSVCVGRGRGVGVSGYAVCHAYRYGAKTWQVVKEFPMTTKFDQKKPSSGAMQCCGQPEASKKHNCILL